MRNDARANAPRNELLTVADAAEECGFSEDTIRRHIAKGSLVVVRVGPTRRVRIRRLDLDTYLKN